MREQQPRPGHRNGSFRTSLGFVLACVGSAVGMGNIWMFPYRLGEYGGAAFLIPYLLFVALFGLVGLSAEFAAGRLCGTGTLGVYRRCWAARGREKLGRLIGWIPLLGSLGIAIGYAVIVGWVLKSIWNSLSGAILAADAAALYGEMSAPFSNIGWHAAVVVLAVLLLMFGATRGIERANKIMMPAFYVLFLILAVRVAFLPGALEGYRFLLVPKWEQLLNPDTWVMAMGQAFFSLSITGSGMIVYGSYMKRDEDIPRASVNTAVFDTLAAMLSALVVMPAVFAFGIAPGSGPSLLFITLPGVFARMPMSRLFAAFFFLSVAFAGITSLINMFEAVAESWQQRFSLSRKAATALCGAVALGVGLFLEDGDAVARWMDFITIIITPCGALLGAVSIYYVLGWKALRRELQLGRRRPLGNWFGFVGRYLYVPLAAIVFILGLVYGGIG